MLPPTSYSVSLVRPEQIPVLINQWRNGQIINALIERALGENHYQLKVDSLPIRAYSSQALPVGSNMLLTVQRQNNKWQLTSSMQPNSESTSHLLTNLLRTSLPRHAPMREVFEKLSASISQLRKDSTLQPQQSAISLNSRNIIQKLLTDLPRRENLVTGESLKQAVKDSGLQLEYKLVRSNANQSSELNQQLNNMVDRDFKANLLRLLYSLKSPTEVAQKVASTAQQIRTANIDPATIPSSQQKEAPSVYQPQDSKQTKTYLLQSVETALANIQIRQVQHLMQDTQGDLAWRFDLPLQGPKRNELIEIVVSRKKAKSASPTESIWSVTVCLELERLGEIRARLRIDNNTLQTFLWAKSASSRQHLKQYSDELRQILATTGLKVAPVQHQAVHLDHGQPLNCAPLIRTST